MLPFESLSNIDIASKKIQKAIKDNANIGVVWDVDMDGVSAGAIMTRYLKHFTQNTISLINQGKAHGLKEQALIEGVDLLVACDSLSDEEDIYQGLVDRGIDVVLLDHHPASENSVATIVNSTVGNYGNPELSGAGVTWKMCAYLDRQMGTNYAKDLVDLACVGIIADVCSVGPESMENRCICNMGFNNLRNPALREILGKYDFNAQSVSYSIAPLINSLQRLGHNRIAIDLFLSDEPSEIRLMLSEIKEYKAEQDKIVADIFESFRVEYEGKYASYGADGLPPVLIGFSGHRGLSGLVATKIANHFCRPTIMLCDELVNTNKLAGSMRSYGDIDLQSLINDTGLAEARGHTYAAGISVRPEDFTAFELAINEALEGLEPEVKYDVDAIVSTDLLTEDVLKAIAYVNTITGKDFPMVSVALYGLQVDDATLMQDKHSKVVCPGLQIIKWHDKTLYEATVTTSGPCVVDVIGTPELNHFAGRTTLQIIATDYNVRLVKSEKGGSYGLPFDL